MTKKVPERWDLHCLILTNERRGKSSASLPEHCSAFSRSVAPKSGTNEVDEKSSWWFLFVSLEIFSEGALKNIKAWVVRAHVEICPRRRHLISSIIPITVTISSKFYYSQHQARISYSNTQLFLFRLYSAFSNHSRHVRANARTSRIGDEPFDIFPQSCIQLRTSHPRSHQSQRPDRHYYWL